MFFFENNFYGRKESSLSKYDSIRSKLIVFWKLLPFPFKLIDPYQFLDPTSCHPYHCRKAYVVRGFQTVNLGVQVLYSLYCPLARDVAVSVNKTCKIGCCDWILIDVLVNTIAHIFITLIWCPQCGFNISYLSIFLDSCQC